MDWLQKVYDMAPANMDNGVFENVQNIQQNHKLHCEYHVKLNYGIHSMNSKPDVKIQRDIFQGDFLSPLQLIIIIIPLSNVLRKFTEGYKFSKLQEKI